MMSDGNGRNKDDTGKGIENLLACLDNLCFTETDLTQAGEQLRQCRRDLCKMLAMTVGDTEEFPERKDEFPKFLLLNIMMDLAGKYPSLVPLTEDLACALAFITVYGRAPTFEDLEGFDLRRAYEYVQTTYAEELADGSEQ